ncbi:hypothetical protein [Moorena sp. SIO3H5]|nr:hypothetical protein [Moorena sp. SIO3H5]
MLSPTHNFLPTPFSLLPAPCSLLPAPFYKVLNLVKQVRKIKK